MAAPPVLPIRPFATLVANFAAGVQGRAAALVDFSIGSVLRAVAESAADLTLWLQSLGVYILTLTRAATSKGSDLDTWMADFGFARLPGTTATGTVTLARFTAAATRVVIPVGAQVQTSDGAQRFTVYASPAHPAYSTADAGYVLAPSIASVDVPVQALVAGAAGNVVAGAIALVSSSISSIDTVTNAAALTNGREAEQDPEYRARFVLFINALSRGTKAAYESALANLGLGLDYDVRPGRDPSDTFAPGVVTVYVDDGSGAIPAATLQAATDACWAVRAAGVRLAVLAAASRPLTVTLTLTVAPGFYKPTVSAQVSAAITLFLNGLGMADPVRVSRLAKVAYDASPGMLDITDLTVNGQTTDLAALPGRTFVTQGVLIS